MQFISLYSSSSSVPDELKSAGQTIDIEAEMEFARMGRAGAGCDCAAPRSEEEEKKEATSADVSDEERIKREEMERERKRRRDELAAELRAMGAGELLATVFKAQEERVAAYRAFDG